MNKLTSFLACAVLFAASNALAQGDFRKGYYITLTNDSVPAFIDYRRARSLYKVCIYRAEKSGKKSRYYPGQIKAYGFLDGHRYTSRELPGGPVFMEILVEGSMNLLQHEGLYAETDSLIFLPPPDQIKIRKESGNWLRTNRTYVGLLNFLLSPCDLTANKTYYSEEDIANLVQNYNRCKGGAGIRYKEEIPRAKLYFQAFAGPDISHLTITGFSPAKSVSPAFGIGIDLSTPRFFDRLSFSLDAIYTDRLYQFYKETRARPAGLERTDYYLNMSSIKVPVALRYSFMQEAQTPYIKIGLVRHFGMRSSAKELTEVENNGEVITSFRNISAENSKQAGIWFGLGFSKILLNRWKGFIEFRYERTTESFMRAYHGDPINPAKSVNIFAGIRF